MKAISKLIISGLIIIGMLGIASAESYQIGDIIYTETQHYHIMSVGETEYTVLTTNTVEHSSLESVKMEKIPIESYAADTIESPIFKTIQNTPETTTVYVGENYNIIFEIENYDVSTVVLNFQLIIATEGILNVGEINNHGFFS